MEEPSVLDYLKSKLPWRKEKVGLPPALPEHEVGGNIEQLQAPEAIQAVTPTVEVPAQPAETPRTTLLTTAWPWRSLVALGMALLAQRSLEPTPGRGWVVGVILYLLAGATLVWAAWRKEWQATEIPQGEVRDDPLTVNTRFLALGILLVLIAYLTFSGNRFTSFNVTVWLLGTGFIVWGLWLPGSQTGNWWRGLWNGIQQKSWKISVTRWNLVVLGVIGLILFFRATQLTQVPPEMVSDHAEKLLDVWDVLEGQTKIFFERNTGREAMQMYLTAWVAQVFKTGISFLSLKIGTVLAGLLTLPFIYLLGKEVVNRRVGLLAMLFAGIAYWPNVISRVGLRFPLYPLFVAPTLYYLIRGLKNSNRNDFILAGLALGIGLHGYTPIRILPFVVVIAVGMYLIHPQSKGNRKPALFGLFILAVVSLVVFLPLMRYALENPDVFAYRSFTRLGTVERPLPGGVRQIFLSNLWNALRMFAWDDGEIWVHSVTHRPALDVVSGALFHLGVGLLLARFFQRRYREDIYWLLAVPLLLAKYLLNWGWIDFLWLFLIFSLLVLRYLRHQRWEEIFLLLAIPLIPLLLAKYLLNWGWLDFLWLFFIFSLLVLRYLRHKRWDEIFWLLAIPLLMLPSILSLAFPAENPSLNRMSGAIVPVFLIIGIAGDWLWRSVTTQLGQRLGATIAWALGIFLLLWSATQNYDLVFNQFLNVYKIAAWNTSEMGEVIRTFTETVAGPDSAWVVAYPHWVDTRLVGMNAGYPLKDYAVAIDQIPETTNVAGAKLFLVKPEHDEGLQTLYSVYPDGVVQLYESDHEGHNFLMYFVTPER